MKKLGTYIAIFLAGFSTMAIIALKWFNGDDYSIEIKKLKQKRVTGDATMQPIIETAETPPKKRRDKKPRRTKEQRKADRLDKKRNKA